MDRFDNMSGFRQKTEHVIFEQEEGNVLYTIHAVYSI